MTDALTGEATLPPAVTASLESPLRDYWLDRVRMHEHDTYAGVGISKFPEDLRMYEHLLWAGACDAVIEIGARDGGSALWFRDRLRTQAGYRRSGAERVITIDIDEERVRRSLAQADPDWERSVTVVGGDVLDPALPGRVERLLPAGARAFVVEDSAHTYETTFAALRGFARFVPDGGYFVVEDGCVDIEQMRADPDWPRGVLPAIGDWLTSEEGARFQVRRDLERYGLSCHPGGFLQRVQEVTQGPS